MEHAPILSMMVRVWPTIRYVGATEGPEECFDCTEHVQKEAQLVTLQSSVTVAIPQLPFTEVEHYAQSSLSN